MIKYSKTIGSFYKKHIHLTMKNYAIESLNGVAIGIFGSLIIGLILEQIGINLFGSKTEIGKILIQVASIAKFVMGGAIGVSIANCLKSPKLVLSSSVAVGMLGAQAKSMLAGPSSLPLTPGDPIGALLATLIGVELGKLVSGKTKLDILVTPAVTLFTGGIAALFLSPPISKSIIALGAFISRTAALEPISMGIIISVIMGMILTSPMSSAAIAIMLNLTGIAAGAATVGCTVQMVGFAVSSYRENGVNGLFAQGIGTAKLQGPNIIKKPLIWLPTIITSAILGPISTNVFSIVGKADIYHVSGLISNAKGAGMGSCGFVGQMMVFSEMGFRVWPYVLILHFILPALLTWAITEYMRKRKWIQFDDLKLEL